MWDVKAPRPCPFNTPKIFNSMYISLELCTDVAIVYIERSNQFNISGLKIEYDYMSVRVSAQDFGWASCSLFASRRCNSAWWVRAALYCDITAALLDFMLLFIKVCLLFGFYYFCRLRSAAGKGWCLKGKSEWKCCKWYFIRSWQNRGEIGDIEMYRVGKIKMATELPT